MSGKQNRIYKYKAFISYSHADTKLTKWLHRKLEAYQVPKHLVGKRTENGLVPTGLFPIFRDRDELAASTHMTDAILEALENSQFLIVVCTPSSAQSKLVQREIEEFKRIHGNKNILCLIAGGVPFSGNPETDCFPDVLKQHIRPDGTAAGWAPEGLAADIRPGSDGKQAAVTKLVAGIIGVELNDLRRRELQRERGKLILGLVASIGAFALISILLVMTYRSQELAEERTDALLNFLLQSHEQVFQALDADGNTRTQETLIRMTLEQFENFDLENADVKTLGLWSGAALRLAQNLERQGENDSAADLFTQIRDFSARFAAEHPTSHFARFRLQNADFFYGYHQQRLGFYDQAETIFRNRLDVATKASNDPTLTLQTPGTHIEWDARVADSQQFLGILLAGPQDNVEEGKKLMDAALAGWQNSIDTFEPNESNGNDSYYRWSKGFLHIHIGDLKRRLGQLEDAQAHYQNSADIYTNLLPLAPGHRGVLRRIAVANNHVAQVMLERGDISGAVERARTATGTLNELVDKNQANVLWLNDLAEAQNMLVRAALKAKDYSLAAEVLQESKETSPMLIERDDMRPQYHVTNYRAQLLQAEYALQTGDDDGGLDTLNALVTALNAERGAFLQTNGAMELRARSQLLAALHGPEDTRKAHLKTIVDIANSRPNAWPQVKAYQAFALRQLGDMESAESIRADLQAAGFANFYSASE